MATASILVNLFDGARRPLVNNPEVLLTIYDSKQRNRLSQFVRGGSIRVKDLNIFDDGSDNCAVIASVRGCSDGAFFPVPLSSTEAVVDLMLPPRKPAIDLTDATWERLSQDHPDVFDFLAGAAPSDNRDAYEKLRQNARPELACFFNITTAIQLLPDQRPGEVLDFFKKITLETFDTLQSQSPQATVTEGLRQDRFFAWAEPGLEDYLQGHPKLFVPADPALHPGADESYKEVRFGEANLQFTFHKKKELSPPGTKWMKVEMDMDLFHDLDAHFLLEVVPNELFTRAGKFLGIGKPHLTNPAQIYALRWVAGKRLPGEPEFAPPYTLTAS